MERNIIRYINRDARRRNAEKSVRLAELQPLVDAAVSAYKATVKELEEKIAKREAALKAAEEEVARLKAEIDAQKASGGVPKETTSTTQPEAAEAVQPKKAASRGR